LVAAGGGLFFSGFLFPVIGIVEQLPLVMAADGQDSTRSSAAVSVHLDLVGGCGDLAPLGPFLTSLFFWSFLSFR
jgi:hypothetical protein